MTYFKNKRILIVGLGLIGGSYAEGLSKLGVPVDAVDNNEETIAYALSRGMIREGRTETTEDFLKAHEIIISALYPTTFLKWVETYGTMLSPGTLLTDVTGVKSGIVYRVSEMLPPSVEFVAGHPMAGRESSGVENADASAFIGANYIITPTAKNTEGVLLVRELAQALRFGSISELTPETHDEMIAFLSQLTHCIAVSLMTCRDTKSMVEYTGDSFRDLTRIAKINEKVWPELFLMNRDALLKQMDLFQAQFSTLRDQIERGDASAIAEMMRIATKNRYLFDKTED